MAFRFSLEVLLRLRSSYERRERLRLLGLQNQLVQVEDRIRALACEQSEAHAMLAEHLRQGILGAEVHLELACAAARARFRKVLGEQRAALERQHHIQRRAYLEARGRREMVERLRSRRLELYRQVETRREQGRLDELSLLRRGVSSRS